MCEQTKERSSFLATNNNIKLVVVLMYDYDGGSENA